MAIRQLLHVPPYLSSNDGLHIAGRDTILAPNAGELTVSACVLLSDGADNRVVDNCARVTFPLGVVTPALCLTILAVIHVCTQEQVIWVAAWGIVALVQDMLAFGRHFPMRKEPSNSMCKRPLASKSYTTVALLCGLASFPYPATGGILFGITPEDIHRNAVRYFTLDEVVKANAQVIPASMAYSFLAGIPKGEYQSKAVRCYLLSLVAHKSLSVAALTPLPYMTGLCFLDLRPKVGRAVDAKHLYALSHVLCLGTPTPLCNTNIKL